jgi:hypothetical protein
MTNRRAWCAVAVLVSGCVAAGCGGSAKLATGSKTPSNAHSKAPSTPPSKPQSPDDPTALPEDVRTWCNKQGFDRFELVCFDASDGDGIRTVAVPPATFVQPNVGVVVKVWQKRGTQPTVELDGVAGTRVAGKAPTFAAISAGTGLSLLNVVEALRRTEPERNTVGTFVLSPRVKPGPAKLTLTADASHRVEQTLVFTEKYSSAVRVGIGLAFGGAVRPEYSTRVAPGSATQVIEESNAGDAALELVIGVAPFVFDRLLYDGRSYDDPDQAHNWRLAPYLGFGALSADPSGIEALKSLHAGLEIELSPGVSLAGTAVVRRVKVLRDGMREGSPTMDGEIPLTDTFGVGAALILNATPDVFRFTAGATK